jgi:hypothetical protein
MKPSKTLRALPAGRPLFQDASANFFPHSLAKVDTHLAERGAAALLTREPRTTSSR